MNGVRNWIIGAVAASGVLLAGGFVLGVQPALAAASSAETATGTITAQSQTLQVTLAGLARTAAKKDQLGAEQDALLKAVPPALRANTFVRRVNTLAAQDGVLITAITPGAGQPYTPPASIAAAAAATAAAAAAATATPTPTPSATAAEAAPAAAVTVPVQAAVDPSISSANLTVIPITLSFSGASSDALLDFVHDMQGDERLFFVSNYSSSVDPTSSTITGSVKGYLYALKR